MAGKKKSTKKTNPDEALWVSPRSLMKGPDGERAWDNRPGGPPHSQRMLELADIALGLKKTEPRKKPRSGAAHQTAKTEPYSKLK